MTTYKDAGVNIEAGDALVDQIKPLAAATSRRGVMGGLGGFGALFDLKAAGFVDPVLVSSTDGVGTKLLVAIETGLHATVGTTWWRCASTTWWCRVPSRCFSWIISPAGTWK